ncbi:hypothetical protein DASC09_017360 [Saccharomycopsis crataegensis]|uniref:Uncharacterized protein n=1 Tax=Saccharomycopsis crataegensis TaxID=43959 RepID=A0AAV5QIG9_9ASCO|nr:hypothetical protein DASC09_017360 [Saccharomycopsis crataegensis]
MICVKGPMGASLGRTLEYSSTDDITAGSGGAPAIRYGKVDGNEFGHPRTSTLSSNVDFGE